MEYIQNITLDLNSNNAAPIVNAKQNDIDSRILRVHYTKDGVAYPINGQNSVAFRMRKPDSRMVFISTEINDDDGTVDVTLSQQCLTVAGRAYADLVEFNAAGQMLSTVSFIINIQASPDVMGEEAVSSDDFSYLVDTLNRWNRTVAEAQEWATGYFGDEIKREGNYPNTPGRVNNAHYFNTRAEAWANGTIEGTELPSSDGAYNKHARYQAKTAEAWAVGTRDGASIGPSDPAYGKYAKHWAEKAEEDWNKLANATASGTFTGADEDPSIWLDEDPVTGSREFKFVIPRSNAVYVTFDVDYDNGNLYMFRPDVATIQDLTWSVNPTTGNLEVGVTGVTANDN